MFTREQIAEVVAESMADIFMMDKQDILNRPELDFRVDLNANSIQYFPLISDIEERLDIELEGHEFQWVAKTFSMAVDFVYEAYSKQK